MTTIVDSENILLNINSPEEVNDFISDCTLEGKWDNVILLYKEFPEQAHKAIISDSAGTALHVAIDLGEEDVVKELVNAIEVSDERVKALEMENERGDTPLHFAASRGFARICKCIIGINNERIDLLSRKNKHGETPLFQAAINWRKQTFAYLAHISKEIVTLQDLVRDDGDSILHTAIRGEYFDLAVIIAHYYEFLGTHPNNEESTPLKLLANKPSAFKSSSSLPWYKRILYHYILVEPLNANTTVRSELRKMENYTTLRDFVSTGLIATLYGYGKKKQYDPEDPSNGYRRNYPVGFLPPNYETFHRFVKCAYVLTLGLLVTDIKEIKIAKNKHIWSSQLLKALMKRPYAAFTGSGGQPTDSDREIDSDMYNVIPQWKRDDKETPFLVAARNGIVEMVNEIIMKIPSAIHNINSRKQNVLHVAVKYRQPLVVETLRLRISNLELWNSLILARDDEDNTILHLTSKALGRDKPEQIASSALQMMWNIKWFQYIKSLVPQHFNFRPNKDGYTAREIFNEANVDLIKDSNEWLKTTSESCSVVAVLVAGASFTTASTIPGGTMDGRPILEGNPAFNVFAFASLSGLCFSFTALIMFLSILTSQKQFKDYRMGLPRDLCIGLSSLLWSIASMWVSFCSGHYFLLSHRFKSVLFPVYVSTCLLVALYGIAQMPLYFYLLTTICTKIPRPFDNGDNF